MSRRLRRYHVNFGFPEDWEDSAKSFSEKISQKGPLTLSVHAVEKLVEISHLFGTELVSAYFKIFKSGILSTENLFEFYRYNRGSMYKACFRHKIEGFPVDLVTVISESGNVVTIFHTHVDDTHTTLNRKLYEKGVNVNGRTNS